MFAKVALLSAFVAFAAAQAPSMSPAKFTSGADSSFCLTAPTGYADSSDFRAVVATCGGSEASGQGWQFPSVNGGVSVQIQTTDGSRCLAVANGNTAEGAEVHLQPCDSSDSSQYWTYTSANTVEWTNSGKCLNAPTLKDNVVVTSTTCGSASSMSWSASSA